jgi:glucose/mannose-6-phosphate isomerase
MKEDWQVERYDPSGMRRLLEDFPQQCEEAIAIGRKAKVRFPRPSRIVVTGLGGSAIGGDLLRSYLAGESAVPIFVNRSYELPAFVGKDTLVIANSYSGNTEETLSAYRDAKKRGAKVIVLSTGGQLAEQAKRNRDSWVVIPSGLPHPPRAALGYAFFPMLLLMMKNGIAKEHQGELKETVSLLSRLRNRYSLESPLSGNHAKRIARALHGKLAILYSASERFDAVTLRWRNQLNENAKTLAYSHLLPEMNHNEIVGWEALKPIMNKAYVLVLRDRGDHPRVQYRMEITKGLIAPNAEGFEEVWSEGASLLARIFSLIHLGDWSSYYLAMLNRVDPMPVKKIDFLKSKLAERR